MATDQKRRFREGAAKVSGAIAQQMDSAYGTVANPSNATILVRARKP